VSRADEEQLPATVDLLMLLDRLGYAVEIRAVGAWYECLVEGHGETWLASGSTEERVLAAAVRRMAGSYLALACIRLAPAPVPATLPRPLTETHAPAPVAAPAAEPTVGVEERLRQRLHFARLLLVSDSEDRDVATRLGRVLDATVERCDRGDPQQILSRAKKVRRYEAVILHAPSIAESPFLAPAGAARIPVVAVRVLRVSACIAALADALGMASNVPPPPHEGWVHRSVMRSLPFFPAPGARS
jgi:hypothetical protein